MRKAPIKIGILDVPFEPERQLTEFREGVGDVGAIVSFIGVVRVEGGTRSLTLSHYPGYTEKRIGEIVEDALGRFSLSSVLVLHRVGCMEPKEPIVLVATAATHRRAAFEGADFLMDYLKSAAPFWKKEQGTESNIWIEPTERDIADRKRWEGRS